MVRCRLCALSMCIACGGLGDEWVLGVVGGCEHGSLGRNGIGNEGCAAIAGALRHVPSLTQLEYVVGEGASHEVAG